MTRAKGIPTADYGVARRTATATAREEAVEQVRRLGYAAVDAGYAPEELRAFGRDFDRTRDAYLRAHGEAELRRLGELHTVRSPLAHGGRAFLDLALNAKLLAILDDLIEGKFILNQQNGLVNPPGERYEQAAWHRDLPYQHFVSTKPLAVNALFCVDDFTVENGATFVLPASHHSEEFPSPDFVRRNAVQVEAKAGSFIVMDCMAFHAGGYNSSANVRRAVNHVYTIPYFKQQISLPRSMPDPVISPRTSEILGFTYREPASVAEYLSLRSGRGY